MCDVKIVLQIYKNALHTNLDLLWQQNAWGETACPIEWTNKHYNLWQNILKNLCCLRINWQLNKLWSFKRQLQIRKQFCGVVWNCLWLDLGSEPGESVINDYVIFNKSHTPYRHNFPYANYFCQIYQNPCFQVLKITCLQKFLRNQKALFRSLTNI